MFRRVDHVFNRVVEFVGTSQLLQVFPIPFDQIEFRTIRRQPNNQETMFKEAQCSQDRSTFVIRDIIHHQKDAPGWIALHEQIFDELQERLAVLPSSDFPRDHIGVPRVSPQNVTMFLGTRLQGWNNLLLTLFHPTGM